LDIERIQHVLASEDSIFVESGSTLAYCMLSVIDNREKYRPGGRPLKVCTNNVAVYMMLLFGKGFDPVLLPGKPDNPYAATFGDITEEGGHGNLIPTFLRDNGVKVLFTTASYLDIDYGPHVSSVQNHTMKRILNEYASSSPDRTNVFVIVAEKVNRDVAEKSIDPKCKLIFDPHRTENVAGKQQVLSDVAREWRAHLRKPTNYIIAGSANATGVASELTAFEDAHEMKPFTLHPGRGVLAKFRSE